MKYATLGKVLAVVGAISMFRAMTMSVVGGTVAGVEVANIPLMNERSNLLMLGGFLLIAGVILYGVSKLKQTPADEKKQADDRQAAISSIGTATTAATNKALSTTGSFLARLVAHFRAAPDVHVNRVATGLFVGLCVGATFDALFSFLIARTSWHGIYQNIASPIIFLIVVFAIWYAFGSIAGYRRIRTLHLVNLAVVTVIPVFGVLVWLQRGQEAYVGMLEMVAFGILLMLVSAIWIYLSRPGKIN